MVYNPVYLYAFTLFRIRLHFSDQSEIFQGTGTHISIYVFRDKKNILEYIFKHLPQSIFVFHREILGMTILHYSLQ